MFLWNTLCMRGDLIWVETAARLKICDRRGLFCIQNLPPYSCAFRFCKQNCISFYHHLIFVWLFTDHCRSDRQSVNNQFHINTSRDLKSKSRQATAYFKFRCWRPMSLGHVFLVWNAVDGDVLGNEVCLIEILFSSNVSWHSQMPFFAWLSFPGWKLTHWKFRRASSLWNVDFRYCGGDRSILNNLKDYLDDMLNDVSQSEFRGNSSFGDIEGGKK
jgi:hypothetical protein